MIKNILNCSSKQLSNTSLEQAKLCYALMMLTSIQTKFTDINMNWWVIKSFEKLLNNKNIKDILSIFESGDPIDIYKTQNKFIN
ncbi:hypothetical protein EXQ36_10145 [Clostridium botulinum]|nr:hypothetical protein [Clostridium botulinum]MBO0550692.1 hypothetical protein [Clostridium botulinum]MBO0584716.1 hypothetical protein [Clostridium botulinum]